MQIAFGGDQPRLDRIYLRILNEYTEMGQAFYYIINSFGETS